MDIVTHGMTGVLIARALPQESRISTMAVGLMGALAPDLDFVVRLWDPMSAITVHRTVTHSLLGGALVALVVAALVRQFSQENFPHLLGVAYLGVLSHIALDLLTPFGTAILWPLTDRRLSLGQHHVIDPVFSVLVLGFLIATFSSKGKRISLARVGLTGVGLYILVTSGHQRMAFSRWEGLLDSQGITPIRSTVIPLVPGPFRWLGVAETKDAFHQKPFWLLEMDSQPPTVFPKSEGDFGFVENLKEVKSFLRFARFPWRHVWKEGTSLVVEYQELAFADHPLGGPLSLRIWMGDAGSVDKIELGHRF